jgi:hypothetical protein
MGDVANVLYLGVFAAYVTAAVAFALSLTSPDTRAMFVVLFTAMLAAYFLATVAMTCWLYRDLLRRRGDVDALGWLAAFLLLGGIALPAYYFTHGIVVDVTEEKVRMSTMLVRILAAFFSVTGAIIFGWSVTMALGHAAITPAYRSLRLANQVLLWTGWVTTVALLMKKPWPARKKFGWAVGSLIGNFLLMPVVAFAEIER